ncbi:MAG: hypothetical protein ABI644_12535 [Arenimonas sp.]
MSDLQQEGLQHFISKWYAREPEMQFAEVFVPASDKLLFHVWGALLHELKHTLFELSESHITEIKTAWWADEFRRLSMGQPRHPLTQALPDVSLPWSSLAAGMLSLIETSRTRASNTEQAIANLLPFAGALTDIEDSLFHAKIASSKELFAMHCLLHRLPNGLSTEGRAGIPMHLMARYSVNTAQLPILAQNSLLRDWAAELNSALQVKIAGTLFRSARARFDQAILKQLLAGKGFLTTSAPLNLWRAWRAAAAVPR